MRLHRVDERTHRGSLLPDETFPVNELTYWEGLVLNLQIREKFKLHQLQAQDEMLNGQHWRLADDVMRFDNRVGVLEALVNERGDLVIDGGEY